MEYDLITLGLRLDWIGTPRLSWRDLLVIARQSPMTSALSRAMYPKTWDWDLQAQLTRLLLNATCGSEVVKIPGADPEGAERKGKGGLPIDELHEFLYGNGGK